MSNEPKKSQLTAEKPTLQKVFNQKTIRKGVIYFIILSLLSMTGVFLYFNTGESYKVLQYLDVRFLLLALFLSGMDMWLGGYRYHIFCKQAKPDISWKVSFNSNLANIFMGAVTPSQTGGGPAQIYILYRGGIKMIDSITMSFINWISTLVFFPISGAIALYIIRDRFPEGALMYLAQYGFFSFLSFSVLIFVALFKPHWVGMLIRGIAAVLQKINQGWSERLSSWSEKAMGLLAEYRQSCQKLLYDKPILFVYSFLLTIVLYFNKWLLAYFLVLGLGIIGDFWSIIAIQAVLDFLLYFAPSPGGSGFAEFGISTLMSGLIQSGVLLSAFTMLNRTFLKFIPAFLGAFVVLQALKQHSEDEEEKEATAISEPEQVVEMV